MVFLHQLQEFTLAHHRIVEVEPCKFVLMRRKDAELCYEPIVERAVNVEFQGANRVRYLFYGVALAMGVVIHRINCPFVACAVVRGMKNTVHYRIPHVHVRMSHVDFRSQCLASVGEFSVSHSLEKIEVLLHAAVSVRTVLSRSLHRASVLPHFFQALVIDVCETFPYQIACP